MTNTTHAKRSEDYLYGVDGRDPEGKVVVRRIDSAQAHATLAIATAVRELAETLHADVNRITRMASDQTRPIRLMSLTGTDGDPFVLNATAVVAVIPDTQGVVRIDVGDREYFVLGNVHEITSLVFQAVAA
jgi:hypothetical protein